MFGERTDFYLKDTRWSDGRNRSVRSSDGLKASAVILSVILPLIRLTGKNAVPSIVEHYLLSVGEGVKLSNLSKTF